MSSSSTSSSSYLLRSRQKSYFLRHITTLLPQPYTSSDANRILLGYFIVSGLDLLDILGEIPNEGEGGGGGGSTDVEGNSSQRPKGEESGRSSSGTGSNGKAEKRVTEDERRGFIEWIYSLQLENGEGFRGFTGAKVSHISAMVASSSTIDEERASMIYDPGNVPSTYLALMTLLVLGDDLSRVKRAECLGWLPRLQRTDGSFGETLGTGEDGKETIEGGSDMRFCCCAAGIRWVLRGAAKGRRAVEGIKDLDVKGLIRFVRTSQNYDGGFSSGPSHESHSGLAYCAINTLHFLGKLPDTPSTMTPLPEVDGISLEGCVRWLLQRQTSVLEEEEEEEYDDEEDGEGLVQGSGETGMNSEKPVRSSAIETNTNRKEAPVVDVDEEHLKFTGFNGRPEKIADTCYCWWNTATLAVSIASS